eukprot:gene29940-9808_t
MGSRDARTATAEHPNAGTPSEALNATWPLDQDPPLTGQQESIVRSVGTLLGNIVLRAAAEGKHERRSMYDSDVIPDIPLRDYLRYSNKSTVICAVVLMDKVFVATSTRLTPRKAHRLLLTALVIAHKVCHDVPYNMGFLADVGGVEMAELHRLERTFLRDTQWEVNVGAEQYDHYTGIFARLAKQHEEDLADTKEPRVAAASGTQHRQQHEGHNEPERGPA